MRPEQKMNLFLLGHLPNHWQIERVENVIGRGTPDMYICREGVSLWLECKVEHEILRPEQYAWHQTHLNAGGYVFCIVSHDDNKRFSLYDASCSIRALAHGVKLCNRIRDHVKLDEIIIYLSEI